MIERVTTFATDAAPLVDALTTLRERVAAADFILDAPGAAEARASRDELLEQLDEYVLPRLRQHDAPLIAVVAGSTGAGKSTLVNSLVRAHLTASGARRPTTHTPVLACHPEDASWFGSGGMLPSLPCVRAEARDSGDEAAAPASALLAETSELPRGLALLDAPDVDSFVEEHHELSHRLLAAADLWLFVTTAARYADGIPWALLHTARERGATLAVVCDRVPIEAGREVPDHLATMLGEGGLDAAELFVVPETTVTEGLLPPEAVESLRSWLSGIATDEERRGEVTRGTLEGVLDSFRTRVPALAKQAETQAAVASELRHEVDTAYADALAEIDEATRNGSLLRGEALVRWQDFVGAGDLVRSLRERSRPRRERGASRKRGAPRHGNQLRAALRKGLESLIKSGAERAAENAVARWRAHPAGNVLLEGSTDGLASASVELPRRAAQAVAGWQDYVADLIRTEGATKRSMARVLSLDAEGLALILMVGVLGYGTGETAVATGTSAVPQRLLKTIFGADALRSIAAKARTELRGRVGNLFDEEAGRFAQVLASADVPDDSTIIQLYQAGHALEAVR